MGVAILGNGYTGSALQLLLQKKEVSHRVFSRSFSPNIVQTDLSQKSGLEILGRHSKEFGLDRVVITFPIQDLGDSFLEEIFLLFSKVILYGTTSIYQRNQGVITEDTPLQSDHSRWTVERKFQERGGVILRLSGIYGPGRNPADWVKKGLVGVSDRQLNLIHRDDIAESTFYFLQMSEIPKGQVWNLSDGQIHTWRETIDFLHENGSLKEIPPPDAKAKKDAFISNEKIRAEMAGTEFREFWRELESLEGIKG